MKGWKNILHTNRDQKKAGVAILISDKIDCLIKPVKRDKEGHHIMIKGSIQEEDITIINIYATNIGTPQYIRQRSVFIPIPKKGNAKECSNYHTTSLISHTSKVMLKILQPRLQQYVNREFPDVQAGFRKGRRTRDKIASIQPVFVFWLGHSTHLRLR